MVLKLFWWSPLHMPKSLATEIYFNGRGWMRLAVKTRRPFVNFGDYLSSLVVEAVSGEKVRWANPQRADLFAIGSILDIAAQPGCEGLVWGSGTRSPKVSLAGLDPDRLLAVRGPRTKQVLGESNVPLGDPGLFAGQLQPGRSRRSGATLIPHFSAYSSSAPYRTLQSLATELGARVYEPSCSPRDVLEAISRSDVVYSSSLHGLICAHALGVPAIAVSLGKTTESTFKYEDHYESLGLRFRRHFAADLIGEPARRRIIDVAAQEAEAIMTTVDERRAGLSTALKRVL